MGSYKLKCRELSRCMNEWLFLFSLLFHSPSSQNQGTTERICGRDINFTNETNNRSGVIVSPNWPEDYPPNINCLWRLLAPTQINITVKIEFIDIESNARRPGFIGPLPNGGCVANADRLEIKIPTLDRFGDFILCNDDNQDLLQPLSTFEGLVEIIFVSDTSSQGQGFNISYWFDDPFLIEDPPNIIQTATVETIGVTNVTTSMMPVTV